MGNLTPQAALGVERREVKKRETNFLPILLSLERLNLGKSFEPNPTRRITFTRDAPLAAYAAATDEGGTPASHPPKPAQCVRDAGAGIVWTDPFPSD